jgi:3-oxoadipate enol-lactonase
VLIHGWTATADTNFHRCYRALAGHARVVAFDQRGHGEGLRTTRPFRLRDCADDVAVVADALDVGEFVPIGYSMGGAIAQLVWRRHTDRVTGLVLCATASRFGSRTTAAARTAGLGGLAAMARVTPSPTRRWIGERLYLERKRGYWDPWTIELAQSHDWRAVLEAGAKLGRFRSDPWLGRVDVPTAVVVPTRDQVIPPPEQYALAGAIPGAAVFAVDGDHLAVATATQQFVPALVDAVAFVTRP